MKTQTDPLVRPRLLLLLPKDSYRNEDFLTAAERLDIEIVEARNQCHRLANYWALEPMLALPFDEPDRAAKIARQTLSSFPPTTVLAVDDEGVEAAAAIATSLGLKTNPPAAVAALRDKYHFRQLQDSAGLPYPRFRRIALVRDEPVVEPAFGFPCVVKPSRLSGSQGVIRVNNVKEMELALARVGSIVRSESNPENDSILIEQYLPGSEHALEGILEQGVLRELALFDKLDQLEGPYFAETSYVSPSVLPASVQENFRWQIEQVCRQAGVTEGPIHAEARVHGNLLTLLEVAPRSIGGLCARILHYHLGVTLEEIILRHAIGAPIVRNTPVCGPAAMGVMMIPVPANGVFEGVDQIDWAMRVAGIESIEITARKGDRVIPLPEASVYLGFIFARGESASEIARALQTAAKILNVNVRPLLEVGEIASG